MPVTKPKVTKRVIEQRIDLEEAFGVDFTGKRNLREIIGERIIEKIRERTESGTGMTIDDSGRGHPSEFKGYSKEYRESPEFKAFGKSPTGKVNLKLTGDMLELIDIKKQDSNSITIGVDSDEVLKAYNHQTGDTVPRRPWFGISKGELMEIVQELKPEVREATKIFEEEGRRSADEFLLKLADEILGEE